MAESAKEAAPWHGRATYGARLDDQRQTPSVLCTEQVAMDLMGNARLCVSRADVFVGEFFKK
jgi:hypothetical protein